MLFDSFFENILLYTSLLPFLGIFALLVPNSSDKTLKQLALGFSSAPALLYLIVLGGFKNFWGGFQYTTNVLWLPSLNLNVSMGVDGISLFFVLLTVVLIPLCFLISWNSVTTNLRQYLISFLFIEFLLVNVFCVLDVLFFYIFFESVLIPMYVVIGVWGSRERKSLASYYFFLYTLMGSVLMLISILYIYYQAGTTDYEILLSFKFSLEEQKFIWLTFFIAFASKMPMMPMHLWLPEAHVEAPTSGSVILAGVLLKLGSYGFIRFSLPLFPEASFFFSPLVYILATISIIYASFTAIRQTDFKRIIAYTSVAHMNVVVLGIFSFNGLGVEGAILQSLSHGFVASALFAIIGVVYERHKTRLVKYYGGLAHTMPLYSTVFLFFTMANIGFPGTSGFVGEFLILTGSFKVNPSVTVFGATGMVLGGCYALWLLNRVIFGNLKSQYLSKTSDLNRREVVVFAPLAFYTLLLGLLPNVCLSTVHMSVNNLIENMYF